MGDDQTGAPPAGRAGRAAVDAKRFESLSAFVGRKGRKE